MTTLRLILRTLPWLLVVGLGIIIYLQKGSFITPAKEEIIQHSLLTKIETLGKLELVKYNFQEITELEEISKKYFNIFQWGGDDKIALISYGTATGCIDLTRIEAKDIRIQSDSIYVHLPEAELCYYKLDMERTHIYSLETNSVNDEKEFIQKAYQLAERNIRESAIQSGILNQTTETAELILKPLLETVAGKPVVFTRSQQLGGLPNEINR